MNLNARMAFVGIAVVLVALVVGVPVLGAVFAQGGPFGQLVGVTDGTCEYTPSGVFSSTLTIDSAVATTNDAAVLDRRVTVSDGTALGTVPTAVISAPTITGRINTIESGGTNYIIGIGTALGTACSASADSILTPVAGAAAAGNVIVTNDAQLSNNRYAGILSAMILLIPLAVVVFFAMRFVQARMES